MLFAAGDLDPAFGAAGVAINEIGYNNDSAIQADGKVVLVGQRVSPDPYNPVFGPAVVERYRTDGSLDPTFGGDGIVELNLPDNFDRFDAVVIQPDGKIVASGSSLVRLNPDGSTDTTFGGGDGIAELPAPYSELALRPDGKLVVYANDYTNTQRVYRFNANGTADASFGTGGFVNLLTTTSQFRADDLDLRPNGKILLTGTELISNSGGTLQTSYLGVLQLDENGTRDTAYGQAGLARFIPETNGYAVPKASVVLSDGKVVSAGVAALRSGDEPAAALMRFNVDGTPDRSFGLTGTGIANVPLPRAYDPPYFLDLALQPNGKIVAAGRVSPDFEPQMIVTRFHPDGTPDASFSGDGVVLTNVPNLYAEEPNSILIDPQGHIIATGMGSGPIDFGHSFFAVRYQGDQNRDGINFSGGDTLTLEGTKNGDTLTVSRSGDNLVARINSVSRSYPASQVKRLFVLGNDGNDTITIGSSGVLGADVYGGNGNDRITGGAGNDTLEGGLGADYLAGGGGTDTADYFRRTEALRIDIDNNADDGASGEGDNVRGDVENVTGGHGNDVITGSSANNFLFGNDGNDSLTGLFGDDRIDGGRGADFMSGGPGVDTIDYSSYLPDRIHTPTVTVTLGDSLANDGEAGEGDNAQGDNVIGTVGGDRIVGSNNDNRLDGAGGPDTLVGGTGNDTLLGGDGDDRLDGGAGNDLLDGGVPFRESSINTADYSSRSDNLVIDLNNATNLTPAGERDRYVNIDNVDGGSGNDRIIGDGQANRLFGNGGNDTLIGNAGNDVFDGGAGADRMEGGSGRDLADYSRRAENLSVSLNNAANDGAPGEKDDVRSDVENVDGGRGNDRLVGSSALNLLRGLGGNDTLDGGAGDDQLYGGAGDDVITGGAGKDRMIGEDGNDTFYARDGFADVLDGRSGTADKAQKDGLDSVKNVETILA